MNQIVHSLYMDIADAQELSVRHPLRSRPFGFKIKFAHLNRFLWWVGMYFSVWVKGISSSSFEPLPVVGGNVL